MPAERLPFAPERSAGSAHLPEGAPTPLWRRLDRLVLAVTLLGLLVPWGMLLAGFRPRPIENRPLAHLPAVSVSSLLDGSWFKGADAFLADNVWVRPYAIRVRGEAYWFSGGTGNPAVLRGHDGWLFTNGEFAPDCNLTADQVVAAMQAAAASIGQHAALRFVVVPDKHDIYPEKVAADPYPPSCSDTGRATVRAGLAALGPTGVDGWTPLEALRSAQPASLLYWKEDSHWTPLGAVQIVRPLIQSLGPSVWNEGDVVVGGVKTRTVDLADQLGLRRIESTPSVVLRPSETIAKADLAAPVVTVNARAVFRTTATGPEPVIPGRTLILYDSFFGLEVDLLAPYFADATWIHVGDATNHPELVARFGPFDTVILERVERELYVLDITKMLSGLQR